METPQVLPRPFGSFDATKASQLIEKPEQFDEIKAFIEERDHWQDGDGFTGPKEDPDTTISGIMEKGVKKSFVSENVLGEVVTRRIDGVLSHMPQWATALRRTLEEEEEESEEELTRRTEKDEALRAWFEKRKLLRLLRKHAVGLCCYGRMSLRLRVPAGRLKEGQLSASDPSSALEHIFVETLRPDEAMVYTDVGTMYEAGIVVSEYQDADKKRHEQVEMSYLDPSDTIPAGENNPAHARTLLVQLKSEEGTHPESAAYDLGGQLLHHESKEAQAFISPQMIENQKALNTASTSMRVVGNDASFPVRLLLNALPPGKEIRDLETGEKRYDPEPLKLRPAALLFLEGIDAPGEDGEAKDVKTPGIGTFEAADIDGYVEEMKKRRYAILNEAKQLWVEMSDDATATGESRIQAMTDFERDIKRLAQVISEAGAWLLDTAWSWALDLAGDPGRDLDMHVDFQCKIAKPTPPASLRESQREDVKEGLLSEETYIAEGGVEDVEAERERIQRSDRGQMMLLKRRGEIISNLSGAGAGLEQAAVASGMEELEAKKLSRMDTVGIEQ